MPPDIKVVLRKLADEMEDGERGEAFERYEARLAALEQRKPTADEIREALAGLSDDELAELIRAPGRVGAAAEEELEEREGGGDDPARSEDDTAPKPRRTRPGRKNGRAYKWTVDGTGKVTPTQLAHVYSGPDEPAEVELDEDEPAAEGDD